MRGLINSRAETDVLVQDWGESRKSTSVSNIEGALKEENLDG